MPRESGYQRLKICKGKYATSSPGPSPHSKWRSEKALAKATKVAPKDCKNFVTQTRQNDFVLFD